MAHEIENRNGKWSFAFTGERSAIWHGLGQQARADWDEVQWISESGQNFTVSKIDLCGVHGDHPMVKVPGHKLLIRDDTREALSIVSSQWRPAQNADAYRFAKPFIDAGFATMSTAGTLFDGRRCFILLKTREGFSLPGSDDTEGYILVQISHEYGICDMVLPTAIRVVCNNTLQFALEAKTDEQLKAGRFIHGGSTSFSVEKAEALIEAYRDGLGAYAKKAVNLASRSYSPEQARDYIRRVFMLKADGSTEANVVGEDVSELAAKMRRTRNGNVIKAMIETVETQPGAEMSRGSWWSLFHAVTFHEDHGQFAGKDKSEMPAVSGKLYGRGHVIKDRALRVALQMA